MSALIAHIGLLSAAPAPTVGTAKVSGKCLVGTGR